MKPESIAVLEGRALEIFADLVNAAMLNGRKLRVCVDGGAKIDAGSITGGWTPPLGRSADETGR